MIGELVRGHDGQRHARHCTGSRAPPKPGPAGWHVGRHASPSEASIRHAGIPLVRPGAAAALARDRPGRPRSWCSATSRRQIVPGCRGRHGAECGALRVPRRPPGQHPRPPVVAAVQPGAWVDRLLALGLVAVGFLAGPLVQDISITTGAMGMLYPILVIPIVALAFVGLGGADATLPRRRAPPDDGGGHPAGLRIARPDPHRRLHRQHEARLRLALDPDAGGAPAGGRAERTRRRPPAAPPRRQRRLRRGPATADAARRGRGAADPRPPRRPRRSRRRRRPPRRHARRRRRMPRPSGPASAAPGRDGVVARHAHRHRLGGDAARSRSGGAPSVPAGRRSRSAAIASTRRSSAARTRSSPATRRRPASRSGGIATRALLGVERRRRPARHADAQRRARLRARRDRHPQRARRRDRRASSGRATPPPTPARKVPIWGFSGSPIVVDDLVIVAASGALVGLRRRHRRAALDGPTRGEGYSSPQLVTHRRRAAGRCFVNGAGVTGVAPADGTVLWSHAVEGRPDRAAGGDRRTATCSQRDQRRRRAAPPRRAARGAGGWTATERWTSAGLKPYFNDFVVHKGHAYGFDGNILVVHRSRRRHAQVEGRPLRQRPAGAARRPGLLLVLVEEGELALVQRDARRVHASWRACRPRRQDLEPPGGRRRRAARAQRRGDGGVPPAARHRGARAVAGKLTHGLAR